MSEKATETVREKDDPVSLDDIFNVAKEAALLAGSHIRQAWWQSPREKGDDDINVEHSDKKFKENNDSIIKNTKSSSSDLVTETDHKCEQVILHHIHSKYPSHAIIGEESAGSNKYELSTKPTWVIDPIDGTTNFVHKLALSCVILAYFVEKEVKVGIVYDPIGDEMFWAIKDRGAFLQRFASRCVHGDGSEEKESPIHVSSTNSISNALIAMDPGYSREGKDINTYLSVQRELLLRKVRNIRIIGSTGLNMAYVACGRLDSCFEEGSWETNRGPKIWDIAAGLLLISEAGGVTRDLGQTDMPTDIPLDLLGRSNFCAATDNLAREIMECIKICR